jgi:hypothetical protein
LGSSVNIIESANIATEPPAKRQVSASSRSGANVHHSAKSLRRRAVHSSLWTIGGYGFAQAMRFIANLILTRLLFPEDFGMMALVNCVLQGMIMFSDIGIGPAIIQHAHDYDEHFHNTAWTMQIMRGIFMWLGATVLAWPVAAVYGLPELVPVLCVTAATGLISGFRLRAAIVPVWSLDFHQHGLYVSGHANRQVVAWAPNHAGNAWDLQHCTQRRDDGHWCI